MSIKTASTLKCFLDLGSLTAPEGWDDTDTAKLGAPITLSSRSLPTESCCSLI